MKAQVKKIVIAVIGGTVLLFGIALLVLPGPAFIVIPAGLAILATEFIWAERCLHLGRDKFREWRASRERRQADRATAKT